MNDSIWLVRPEQPGADAIAAELGVPPAIARILANRGFGSVEAAREFLFGSLDGLHDPYKMKGMAAAVARIERAVREKERILIFGDYDVDGVLSVVMLFKALQSLGAEVDYFIPERLKDGYGLKEQHVEVPVLKGTGLVISVDCGVKAVGFVAQAKIRGVDVIVTDHHRPGDALPDAVAVLDPVLEDSGYPDRDLAGVGVAFKLIQALLEKAGRGAVLPHYMKLVAIGTVADVAALRGENRLFVRHGLKALDQVSNTGLRSLIDACGLANRRLSESDLGFRLGPRLNAAGRMGRSDLAVRLFFSESVEEALGMVAELETLNSRRQKTESAIFEQARERIERRGLHERYRCLILGCEEWHRGVVGIVASKIKDCFHRPTILFCYHDGLAHGSGRSISDCALIDLLEASRAPFVSYGGHRLAVGCTLARADMPGFRTAVNALAAERISEADLRRKIRVDAVLALEALDPDFHRFYDLLVPFGVGNPKPVFVTENVEVRGEPQVLQGKHLKFRVKQGDREMDALGWDRAGWKSLLRPGRTVSLAWTLRVSEFRGLPDVSLSVEDLKV